MNRKNTLYYAAAAGTVVVFIIALIGLATCGERGTAGSSSQEQALINAYQQGYLDGYSRGYSDGFQTGMKPTITEQDGASVTSNRGCAVPLSTTDDADSFDDASD